MQGEKVTSVLVESGLVNRFEESVSPNRQLRSLCLLSTFKKTKMEGVSRGSSDLGRGLYSLVAWCQNGAGSCYEPQAVLQMYLRMGLQGIDRSLLRWQGGASAVVLGRCWWSQAGGSAYACKSFP